MTNWVQRKRDTNRMVRAIAQHVLAGKATPDDLYNLAKLTWITNSFEGPDAKYIASTKIPALGGLIGVEYDRHAALASVAADVAKVMGDRSIESLVRKQTGFTNFFKPYRNSALGWVDDHRTPLLKICRAALTASNDRDRLRLVEAIERLPGVPKANRDGELMRPEYYVTPVLFALDPEIRFPIINGNKGVQALLRRLGVSNATLTDKYKAMVALYGTGGVDDAAQLDALGTDMPDFVDAAGKKATKKLLGHRKVGERPLPPKDIEDYEAVREAATIKHRNIHNDLTNRLREVLAHLTLTEGANDSRYDAMVKAYDGNSNLLIEAKSSAELPHLRMAVGQLFNYWFQLHGGEEKPHLAVLLPTAPSPEASEFLHWMKVGVLWFDNDTLRTGTRSLARAGIAMAV